jgi:hypothetical protein
MMIYDDPYAPEADLWGRNTGARDRFIRVLRGDGAQCVNLNFDGTTLSGADFRAVADALEAGKIKVQMDEFMDSGHAMYDSGWNRFFVPMDVALAYSTSKKALLVHEAAHAALDIRRKGIAKTDSESIAYLAQQIYYRAVELDTLGGKSPLQQAGKIVAKKFNSSFPQALISVAGEDAGAMRASVAFCPDYGLASYFQKAEYNGI